MFLAFIVLGILAIAVIGYAFTHPVRSLVSISKYLCILIGLVLLFFTVTVGTELGGPWMVIGVMLTIGAFFAANRLSALRNTI